MIKIGMIVTQVKACIVVKPTAIGKDSLGTTT